MFNYEVLQLARLQIAPEHDMDGRRKMWPTFYIEMPVIERQPTNHGTNVKMKVANPSTGDVAHDFHWFLAKGPRQWCKEVGAAYKLYWRETTHLPAWHSPRWYALEICFDEPKHAMLFKLAWGGK